MRFPRSLANARAKGNRMAALIVCIDIGKSESQKEYFRKYFPFCSWSASLRILLQTACTDCGLVPSTEQIAVLLKILDSIVLHQSWKGLQFKHVWFSTDYNGRCPLEFLRILYIHLIDQMGGALQVLKIFSQPV